MYSSNLRILFSSELIQELQDTLAKPKLRNYFSKNALNEMLDAFDPFINFIKVKSKVKLCRDPKDDFLLSLAKDGKAEYILTGDSDLLDIGKMGQIVIMKIRDFIEQNKG